MTRFRLLFLPAFLAALFLALSAIAQPLHIPLETAAQDKAFSEFNHHLAGWLLLCLGILAFLGAFQPGLSGLARAWPVPFLAAGLYLAFMSDPEVWPMGAQGWIMAFRGNPEAAQHKTFALLLLALGILELKRPGGKLPRALAVWAFPVLALFGAVLLFFHPHGGSGHDMAGMHQAGHEMSESMRRVQREHFWFSVTGAAVVLTKVLADGKYWKKSFVPFLWPLCISVLGILLILYRE